MKKYEITYLAQPDLTEEELKTLLDKIVGFIQKQEGIIEAIADPQKIQLAYQIKERRDAFLICLSFSLNPDKVKEVEKKIKTEKEILRHIMIIKRKLGQIKEKAAPVEEKKVELKKIDQKIEEILNE